MLSFSASTERLLTSASSFFARTFVALRRTFLRKETTTDTIWVNALTAAIINTEFHSQEDYLFTRSRVDLS